MKHRTLPSITASSHVRGVRAALHVLFAAALVAIGLLAVPVVASAATTVTNAQGLHDALQNGGEVDLGASFAVGTTDPAAVVPSGTSVTLDLAGYSLTVTGANQQAGIAVPDGATVVIKDTVGGPGLTAIGGDFGAGIGGGINGNSGAVTIAGGTVTATGGANGSGIGGGYHGADGSVTITGGNVTVTGHDRPGLAGTVVVSDGTVDATADGDFGPPAVGGEVTISGGTVNAHAANRGAGIGGSVTINGGSVNATGGPNGGAGIGGAGADALDDATDGGTVEITGGTVTAIGQGGGAGIGGGNGVGGGFSAVGVAGDGGAVTIGHGAAVTVAAPGGGSAIGQGAGTGTGIPGVPDSGSPTGDFGSLSNTGTLTIKNGSAITVPSQATAHNSGTITGSGTINGSGTVENTGSIAHTVTVNTGDGLSVTDHDYQLNLDATGGSVTPAEVAVYAATLADAGLAPADLPIPTRSGYEFDGWFFDQDATSEPVTSGASLSTDNSDGQPVGVPLYAGWTSSAPACDKTTFQQSFNGAADGDTVTLCGNITIAADDNLPLDVASGASVTLDLDGHTLSVTGPSGQPGLVVPSGSTLIVADTSTDDAGSFVIPGDAIVTNNGTVTLDGTTLSTNGTINNAGTVDGQGTLDASGLINNSGAIAHTVTVGSSLKVKDHHYQLTFDPNGGQVVWNGPTAWSIVNGPTLTSVGFTADDIPAATRQGYAFDGWNTKGDGTGQTFSETMGLGGSSSDGTPVQVTLYAQWSSLAVTLHAYPHGGAVDPTSCLVVTDLTDACTLGQALDLAESGDTIILEADPNSGSDATFATSAGWTVDEDSLTITPADGVHPTLDGQGEAPYGLLFTGTGTLTVTGLTVSGSVGGKADFSTPGGGIVNDGNGTLVVTDSTFTGNNVDTSHGYGGGILNWSTGTVVVTGSTFTGNNMVANGNSIGGGLVSLSSGTVTVTSSTFTYNTVDGGRGGAITAGTGPLTVIASTIVNNFTLPNHIATAQGVGGDDVTLVGTILGGNSPSCGAGVTDLGYNISDDDSCGFTAQSSVSGSAGIGVTLNRLADNGGPTTTMMPFDVSAAVGMIPTGTSVQVRGHDVQLCATTDQRGTSSTGDCNAGSVQGSVAAECATVAGFAAIFDAAIDGDTVSLCSDITIIAGDRLPLILASGESVTLDLNGHTLNVTAPYNYAGVGVPASTVLIVTNSGPADGGTLRATGGGPGAGIGTSYLSGSSGTVKAAGGTVIATAGSASSAGIGGGSGGGHGPTVTIGADAAVTASGGPGIAIGSYSGLGSVTNSGLLTLPAGNSIDTTDGTFTNDGTVNNDGTIGGSGSLDGIGTVDNAGAIAHTVTIGDGQTVKDHHYALSFDAGDGSPDWAAATPWSIVNGPTLESVGYSTTDLPGAARDGYRFTGWYLDADASGNPVDDTTTLSQDSSTDGTPVTVTLRAGWAAEVSLHAYPNGDADSPTSCPVVTDLADACTLAQALSLANDGDTVVLEADPGTGREATFTTTTGWTVPQDNLTIRSAEGVAATLDGQHQAPYVLSDTGVGKLTVQNLTVANSAGTTMSSIGGGIAIVGGGDLYVTGSTFTGNIAQNSSESTAAIGGGIVNLSSQITAATGDVTVTGSTFTGNTTANTNGTLAYGGGIFNFSGSVRVTASTFTGNTVTASATNGGAVGGGIVSVSGEVTVLASTFVDNGGADLSDNSFSGGVVGAGATVAASLFAGEGPACLDPSGTTPVVDAGYNISDDGSCGFSAANNSISDSTGLAGTLNPLADNGGPTQTIAPKPGSPVVGMIPAGAEATIGRDTVTLCPTTDQRGVTSADGAPCNAGSVQSAGPLTITTDSLPDGTVDTGYGSQALAATGGIGDYTWAITSGDLPGGLTLEGSTGTISGTPHAAGTFRFTVQVTDNATFTDTQELSITVAKAPPVETPPTISIGTPHGDGPSTLPDGTAGTPYDADPTVTGGGGPYHWSADDLPPGMTIDPDTGHIGGTPTTPGTYTFTITVTDGHSNEGHATVQITIVAAPPTTGPTPDLTVQTQQLPAATVGSPYRATLHASGAADGVYHWTIAAGSLPDGLSLSDAGLISGTPTAAGTFAFTVSVNDPATADLTIVVHPATSSTPTEPTPTEPTPTGPTAGPTSGPTATGPATVTITPSAPGRPASGGLASTGVSGAMLPLALGGIVLILAGGLALAPGVRRRRGEH
jgi:uncharacterized repeat protein (TIGR02543 family)